MSVHNHSFEAAAEHLGCKERWLRDNYRRFPHRKFGTAIAFSDEDLAAIDAQCAVTPTAGTPSTGETAPAARALALVDVKPVSRARRGA